MEPVWSSGELELLGNTFLFRGVERAVVLRAASVPRCSRESFTRGAQIYSPRRFRRSLGVILAGRVRVNAIAPGWIDTGAYHGNGGPAPHSWADERQHPSGRVGTPEDIARAALFLCDPANRFINGETLVVDGGMTRKMIYDGDEGWSLNP